MNNKDKKELWRWAVANRAFDLNFMLSELRSTFEALGCGYIGLYDKWTVAERQIRVCELELKNLKSVISDIKYEPKVFNNHCECTEPREVNRTWKCGACGEEIPASGVKSLDETEVGMLKNRIKELENQVEGYKGVISS